MCMSECENIFAPEFYILAWHPRHVVLFRNEKNLGAPVKMND